MERLKNPKVILALIVVVLAGIVFFQNRSEIELSVLFIGTIRTAKATALLLAFLAGGLCGALVFSRWHTKRSQSQREKEKEREREKVAG